MSMTDFDYALLLLREARKEFIANICDIDTLLEDKSMTWWPRLKERQCFTFTFSIWLGQSAYLSGEWMTQRKGRK